MGDLKCMLKVFPKKCMLTGLKIDLSYHHIQKVEHNGRKTLENGGILYTGIHQWHHNVCECSCKYEYNENNYRIREYKDIYLNHPEELKEWEDYYNPYYLKQCIDYYKFHHDMAKVKMLRREYERRFEGR